MTVRESGILASLSFSRGKALVQGHDSPSFLWKEVPRRGGGWLTQRNKKQWARSIFSYRHPESSQGIFVAAALLFSLLIRLHEAPYPSNAWSIRLPVFVHTHTPFNRKRKRFLACARNDGTGKRYSRITFLLTRESFGARTRLSLLPMEGGAPKERRLALAAE